MRVQYVWSSRRCTVRWTNDVLGPICDDRNVPTPGEKRRVKKKRRVCVCPRVCALFRTVSRFRGRRDHSVKTHTTQPLTASSRAPATGRGARATRHTARAPRAQAGHKSVCAETRVQTKRGTHANQNRAAAASFPSFRASCASFPSCVPSSPPSTACASWRHSPRSRRCCCRPAGLKGR